MVKPYYSHAGIEIYLGDCREILPQLPKGWCATCSCELGDEQIVAIHLAAQHDARPIVDAVVTDPPYGTGGWRRELSGNGSDPSAKLVREPWDTGEVDWLHLCRCYTAIVFFPSVRAFRLLNAATFLGMSEHKCVYMKKLDPRPQFAGRIAWSIEPIWVMSRYPVKLRGESDVLEASTPREGRDSEAVGHPYQKPQAVMDWLVAQTTHPIIDPFMGSGTTLTAAKKQGRRAIGIEIKEEYCEIAAKRLSQEVFQF